MDEHVWMGALGYFSSDGGVMARHKDTDWTIPQKPETWEQVNTAILMDIRDELKQLNRVFGCGNFLEMPRSRREIRKNTANLPKVKK